MKCVSAGDNGGSCDCDEFRRSNHQTAQGACVAGDEGELGGVDEAWLQGEDEAQVVRALSRLRVNRASPRRAFPRRHRQLPRLSQNVWPIFSKHKIHLSPGRTQAHATGWSPASAGVPASMLHPRSPWDART
eukprot:jgi/Tetstr1/466684/TSEL_011172.t1